MCFKQAMAFRAATPSCLAGGASAPIECRRVAAEAPPTKLTTGCGGTAINARRFSAPVFCQGFSLVELTVVLLLITLIASVAVRETSELGFQVRYDQTKDRLEMIKQAILGNPRQIINGQQAISGFVADMGRLPANLRELTQRSGDCSDDAGDVSQYACLHLPTPGTWTAGAWNNDSVSQLDTESGMRHGWNGPYVTITANPADDDALGDAWGSASSDSNYGWRFEPGLNLDKLGNNNPADDQSDPDGFVRLIVQSLGRDQIANALPTNDYIDDYPPNHIADDSTPAVYFPTPLIDKADWLVDIRSGVHVSFKKETGTLPPISRCSDPTKTTKDTCATPEIWRGGCSLAGYYNKSSCEAVLPTAGTWINCSDGVSANKTACESAGHEWYGEGFGCSIQGKPTKELCSPATWRGCTDDGTITTESACLSAGQKWYGDTIFNNIFNNPPTQKKICMKVFYRTADSMIGMLISDDDLSNDASAISFDAKTITADGGFQAIRFGAFRDSQSSAGAPPEAWVPIGSLAVGIYEFDGSSCKTSTSYYPADRQSPIQVDFHPHTTLPVINW